MAILRMVPNPQRFSEFQYYGTTRLNGTCTQTAATVLAASVLGFIGHDTLVNWMLGLYQDQRNRADPYSCATNGASTVVSVAYGLRGRGVSTSLEVDYHGDQMSYDWQTELRQVAGINPIVLQIANAKTLVDVSSGQQVPVNQGVNYHAICVVGLADEGYVVADGNNPNVENKFAIYPMWSLINASPCGLIMAVTASKPATPTVQAGGNPVAFTVKGGFALFLQNNPSVKNIIGDPLMNEAQFPDLTPYGVVGGGVLQVFQHGILVWKPETNVLWAGGGNVLLDHTIPMVQSLQAQVADLQRQLAAAQTNQSSGSAQLTDDQNDAINFWTLFKKGSH